MGTPLELPTPLPVRAIKFDIARRQQQSPVGSGFIQVIDRVTPFWVAEFEGVPMSEERRGAFEATLEELEGGLQTFYGYDPRRPRPLAYGVDKGYAWGSTPWGASPRVTGKSYSSSTLSFDQLTAGVTFKRGDYFSFKEGNIWWLHKATEDKTVGGGGTVTIRVKPRPLATLGSPISLRLERAGCEMKMLSQKEASGDVETGTTLKWTGVQFIDRAT